VKRVADGWKSSPTASRSPERVAGNLRLRAKLTSNAIPEPLVVEELTRFYAD